MHMFMVGNHFMRKYYTVFDMDRDMIGLADAIIPAPTATLPQ